MLRAGMVAGLAAGLVAGLTVLLAGCGSGTDTGTDPDAGADVDPDAVAVTVFAAASTTDLLSALAAGFERERRVRVRFSFAASSTLAQQIEAGAPADLFMSASAEWMDRLELRDLLEPGSRRDVLANVLVLVVPADARGANDGAGPAAVAGGVLDASFDLPAKIAGRIAVGDPEHVPAGMYAAEALKSLGWWGAVKDRLVPAMDVRAALRLVESGAVGAGIVYGSDAAAANVHVIGAFPESSHAPIRYPAALVRGAEPAARALLELLSGGDAHALIREHGFAPATQAGSTPP